jgi:hypothetical protein
MVAPLVGVAARMAAKKLAEKEAKKQAKESVKESVKEGAKTAAKTAGGAGAAGATYLVGEGMSPSGTGPVTEAIKRKMYENEEEPVKKKSGGSVKMSSASKRADGCAIRGKTKGRMV